MVTQTTDRAQVYDAQGNASGPEISDQDAVAAARQKGRSIGIYGPLTLHEGKADSEWTAKAVVAYGAMQERPVAEPAGDPYAGVPAGFDPDEPPF